MDSKFSNNYNDSFKEKKASTKEINISDTFGDVQHVSESNAISLTDDLDNSAQSLEHLDKLLLFKKEMQKKRNKIVNFTASSLADQKLPQPPSLTPEKIVNKKVAVSTKSLPQKKSNPKKGVINPNPIDSVKNSTLQVDNKIKDHKKNPLDTKTKNTITKEGNNSTERQENKNKILLSIDQSISATIKGGRSMKQDKSDSLEEILEEEIINNTGKNLIPRSLEVDDILSYVPNWMILWGNTLILLILFGLLFMSYHIKYPDVVSGVITVNSSYPPVPLVAKATGLVTLFKEDKIPVLVDEPIGFIKNTTDYQDVLVLKNILTDIQKKLNEGKSFSSYDLPKGLHLGELQSPYNQFFLKLKEQKIQHHVNQNNTTRKGNIDQQLAELRTIQKAKERSLSIKYQEYLKAKNLVETRYKVLYKSGGISAEQLNVKESEVSNLLDIYQNDRMSFNEIKKRILDLNSSKVELDFIKEDQSILSQSSLVAAFEQLNTAVHTWEKKYVLKAPISGNLNFIRFTKNNMYLQQEKVIANIIPKIDIEEDAPIIGELIIPSIGSGKADIGQEVNIALNDYPKKQYGTVLGKVESISNVTIPIPNGNGMVGYKVMVSFPKGLENTLKKEIQFKHNMQGNAEIITEDVRLIERFFHEFRDIAGAK